MSWDVVHSRRLVKHGELPMRYLRVATRYLRVATTLKETSHEFLVLPTTSHKFTMTFLRVSASSHDLYGRDVV